MSISAKRLALISRHEGFRRHLYRDSLGYWTIGFGHAVDRRLGGWCDDEAARVLNEREFRLPRVVAMALLKNDIKKATRDVAALLPNDVEMNERRTDALISMAFNLGRTKLEGFKKMWAAIAEEDWQNAAREALDSRWAKQVGKRAQEIAEILRTG